MTAIVQSTLVIGLAKAGLPEKSHETRQQFVCQERQRLDMSAAEAEYAHTWGEGMVTNNVARFRMDAWARRALGCSVFVLAASSHVFGQWVTYPTPNVPRLANGQ